MRLESDLHAFDIPGKNLRVRGGLQLDRKDLSGDGSDTDFANAGAKPKTLSCSFQLPVAETSKLTTLFLLAERLDDVGDPIIYRITDPLADAMNIRQVYFDGNLNVEENDALRCFDVSFALTEFRSVPEQLAANVEVREEEAETPTMLAASAAELNDLIEEELA